MADEQDTKELANGLTDLRANLPADPSGGKERVFEQIQKFQPKPNDVFVIRIPRPSTEEAWIAAVAEVMDLTEDARIAYPQVSWMFLPNEGSVELITQEQMNQLGWHRGPRLTSNGKRFLYQGGRLKTKPR